jgi:hypothetical protein
MSVYALVNLGYSKAAVEAGQRSLEISTRFANLRARVFAHTGAGIALASIDPLQAQGHFLQAAPLARRVRNWTHLALLVGLIPLMQIDQDPRAALNGLFQSLDIYRSVNSAFGLRNVLRIWLPVFSELELHTMVAIADGAAPLLTIWPARVREGISRARIILGEDTYESQKERGEQLTDHDLGEIVLAAPPFAKFDPL